TGPHPAPHAWTESHLARAARHVFQEDLTRDMWALDPLRPIGGPRVAALPRVVRTVVRWLPHAMIVGFALLFLLANMSRDPGFGLVDFALRLVGSVAIVLPLLILLFRPVGAFWVSLLVAILGAFSSDWPTPGFFAHVVVMALVTVRTRPRVAFEMWLVTFVALIPVRGVFAGSSFESDLAACAVLAAFALGIAAIGRAWWLARGRVTEQETIVADVRGQHTQLEERARIARELHDVVAHHMSVIAIQAEAAPYRVSDPPEELTRSFATIRESAVIALTELRRVLGVLRFETAGAQETPDAPQPTLARLDELIDGVRAVGMAVDVVRTGAERELPQGVELSAFRIVQEALSNALRHAPGSEVRIELGYVLTGIGLRIVNTAPRGEVRPSPGMGHGVLGMKERAAMLGGELTAGPTADGGYEVAAFLPAGGQGADA
ncbi:sensor histidine kinase, partial [Streptomyces sp. URMC 123]|uniref:sensor histidine kinase n=1 Tax=Streptomyces sp. URMC 123 TaxID=3423403 RepID=UPI003F1E275B